ncbi:FAD-dependent urate hydroxylase HpxO [Roseofilum sp. BLCC_M154]|uniref:FAD-dependent urate hydroxylase n=1 Tax=Roseofilum acuticapitatum BLCC-M154 TaxID=3022444 RepID=A0ABT7B033_9CYAN|nr:FAD-dependent urate hydroxylase HpxO [Roseofilum acuticapitatum]MDJ1172177.1 FAD-dependent urate hydroxylase HpxO [Roseofilum acuticapitatum BLCC-M154]
MYHLKAIIIGAGIGGLTTGIALKQAGYEIEIYDKVREFRPAGAGISLWSNGIKVLNQLGLGEEIAQMGGRMNQMEYRSHQDKLLNSIDLHPLINEVGQRPYPVARTDLQALLLQAVGEENVTLNCKCVKVSEEKDGITATFEDGRTTRGDLLISADGIHSIIRPVVTGESSEPRYAGYVNWNGLVEANRQEIDPECWVIYVGEGKRASMMPIGKDRFYFFFGCPMEKGTEVAPENRQQELAEIFQEWPSPVQRLIETLNPLETNRLEIHDLNPLNTLVKGRIALLGDAGHATTPTLGQGGCQAMEDAAVLCRYLVTTNVSVEDALQRYELARKPRTSELVLKARKRTDTIYGKDMSVTQEWYKSLSQESESDVINALAKVILAGPFN